MADQMTKEEFKAMTDKLVATLTSDEMIAKMKSFKGLPKEDRLAEAAKLLSVDGLREQGVNVPDGFRLSSRYFEDDSGYEFGNVSGDKSAASALKAAAPDFVLNLKQKHPHVYENLKLVPVDDLPPAYPTTLAPGSGPEVVAAGACGGAGGAIGGTGGCACGGVRE